MRTIMVTGVGAIIGYGALRSLRAARPDLRLLGTDIYLDAVGRAWCDAFEQAPLTASPDYLPWLRDVTAKHRVDLLMPCIEQDVHRLSDIREELTPCHFALALNTGRLISLSRDKWAMHEELEAIGEEVRIPSYIAGDFETLRALLGLPFLLKPRRSYASKGLVRVQSREDFEPHSNRLGEVLLAQPIVGCDDQEYTVAVFGDGRGNACTSITLQRRLSGEGATVKAWTRQFDSLDRTVARLCACFKPIGPTNFQFRRDGEKWKLLEVNPRISSATSIRSAFGYNEAAMSVDYFLDGRVPSQPSLRSGFACRFIEDHVVYDRDHF